MKKNICFIALSFFFSLTAIPKKLIMHHPQEVHVSVAMAIKLNRTYKNGLLPVKQAPDGDTQGDPQGD